MSQSTSLGGNYSLILFSYIKNLYVTLTQVLCIGSQIESMSNMVFYPLLIFKNMDRGIFPTFILLYQGYLQVTGHGPALTRPACYEGGVRHENCM